MVAHCCSATASCPSSVYVELIARTLEKQYLSLAPYGEQPPATSRGEHDLWLADPLEACSSLDSSTPEDSIVIAVRGNCTFFEKAQRVAERGARGLIVMNNEEGCMYMSADTNATDADLDKLSNMFVASATQEQGWVLGNLTLSEDQSVDAKASFKVLQAAKLDPAALVLLLLATVTLIVAAAWTGMDFKKLLIQYEQSQQMDAMHAASSNAAGSPTAPTTFDRGDEQQIITIPVVLGFVGFTSVMMFVLFFVLNKWIFYVFVFLFAYGAAVASGVCMHTLVATFKPSWLRPTVPVKWASFKVRVSDVAITSIAIVATVVWLIFRKSSWAWVLQDLLGMCFMSFILQTVTLPSLKVASVFLVALFCYDVFMVFITPMFMPRGDSVMVRVATGGDTHEILPILLVVPRLLPGPSGGFSMLGYGDVVVPGLLVMLMRRFDVAMSRGISVLSYTFWMIVAYVVGILLTDAALVYEIGGSKGQPALLYLVPCTLGTAGVLAWARGDLPALWCGEIVDVKDHVSGDASYTDQDQTVEGGAANASAVAHRVVPEQESVSIPANSSSTTGERGSGIESAHLLDSTR